jgi:hypothetical protein
MAYGPDNTLPLNDHLAFRVTVPDRGLLRLSFAFDALWENAICVYREGGGDAKVTEKGNYGRESGDWAFLNSTGSPVTFLVTGWHKRSTPNPGQPWFQSLGKVTEATDKNPLRIGFEDNEDYDYNDARCGVEILGPV